MEELGTRWATRPSRQARGDCLRTSGSDGSQIREYNLPPLLYFPVECRVTRATPAQHRPRLDPALWPEIAARTRRESLRTLAAAYGVSHETIRAIASRVRPGPDEAAPRERHRDAPGSP